MSGPFCHLITNRKWRLQNAGFNRCPVGQHRMFKKCVEASRYYRSVLSYTKKNMLGIMRCLFEPVWFVKRSAIDTDHLRKSLEFEEDLRPAAIAKVYRYHFAAAF